MTVKELIEELKKLPEDMLVVTYDGEYSTLDDIYVVQVIGPVKHRLGLPAESLAVLNYSELDEWTVKSQCK